MAVDLADGPRGIEARHAWINIEEAATLITLGDLTVWPSFRVLDITGLYDFPDIEDNSEPVTEGVGMIEYPSRARAKNVTYTVQVRGRTLQEMRAGGAALRAAFGPDITTGLTQTRVMIITPHPSYGTAEHAFRARCLTLAQGTDVQQRGPGAVPTPWTRTVVIGLRQYDPRVYEWDPESEIGLVSPKW